MAFDYSTLQTQYPFLKGVAPNLLANLDNASQGHLVGMLKTMTPENFIYNAKRNYGVTIAPEAPLVPPSTTPLPPPPPPVIPPSTPPLPSSAAGLPPGSSKADMAQELVANALKNIVPELMAKKTGDERLQPGGGMGGVGDVSGGIPGGGIPGGRILPGGVVDRFKDNQRSLDPTNPMKGTERTEAPVLGGAGIPNTIRQSGAENQTGGALSASAIESLLRSGGDLLNPMKGTERTEAPFLGGAGIPNTIRQGGAENQTGGPLSESAIASLLRPGGDLLNPMKGTERTEAPVLGGAGIPNTIRQSGAENQTGGPLSESAIESLLRSGGDPTGPRTDTPSGTTFRSTDPPWVRTDTPTVVPSTDPPWARTDLPSGETFQSSTDPPWARTDTGGPTTFKEDPSSWEGRGLPGGDAGSIKPDNKSDPTKDLDSTTSDLPSSLNELIEMLVGIALRQHQQQFPLQGFLQTQLLPYVTRQRQTVALDTPPAWNPYGGPQNIAMPNIPDAVREPFKFGAYTPRTDAYYKVPALAAYPYTVPSESPSSGGNETLRQASEAATAALERLKSKYGLPSGPASLPAWATRGAS